MKGKPAKFSPHKSINSFHAVNSLEQLDFAILCSTCTWIDRWANLSHYIIRFHLMYMKQFVPEKTQHLCLLLARFLCDCNLYHNCTESCRNNTSHNNYFLFWNFIPNILLWNIDMNVTKLISSARYIGTRVWNLNRDQLLAK